jgi:hypothetical protein
MTWWQGSSSCYTCAECELVSFTMLPTLQSTGQQLQTWKGTEAEQVIMTYYMPLKVQENFKV